MIKSIKLVLKPVSLSDFRQNDLAMRDLDGLENTESRLVTSQQYIADGVPMLLMIYHVYDGDVLDDIGTAADEDEGEIDWNARADDAQRSAFEVES